MEPRHQQVFIGFVRWQYAVLRTWQTWEKLFWRHVHMVLVFDTLYALIKVFKKAEAICFENTNIWNLKLIKLYFAYNCLKLLSDIKTSKYNFIQTLCSELPWLYLVIEYDKLNILFTLCRN